jgi:hypothetical protein
VDDAELTEVVEAHRLAETERPPAEKIPVHNHVAHGPETRQGANGFRAWWAKPGEKHASCDCGWRPELGPSSI